MLRAYGLRTMDTMGTMLTMKTKSNCLFIVPIFIVIMVPIVFLVHRAVGPAT